MEEEYTLDLKELWQILRKRSKIIGIITFLCVAITGVLSFFVITPTYQASTSIIIGKAPDQGDTTQNQSNSNDIYMYQKLIKTYASIAQSKLVSDKTAALLGNGMTGKDIQAATKVTPETDTQIMDISCESKDPAEAQKMTNTLAATFIEESQKIYPTDNIKIMDEASLPDSPIKPRKKLNLAIAFFIGLIGSIGLSFMLEFMDNTIKTENDVDKYLGLPVLGVIPKTMEEA